MYSVAPTFCVLILFMFITTSLFTRPSPSIQVAYKLLELYIKLRELGHIQYINEGNTGPALSCQITSVDAEERVEETEIILKTWTHEVANLRQEFSWLLFFSVPKLLRLYRLLSEEQDNMDVHLKRIVHEISFLCVNNAETRKRMNIKVQVCEREGEGGREGGREGKGLGRGGGREREREGNFCIVYSKHFSHKIYS